MTDIDFMMQIAKFEQKPGARRILPEMVPLVNELGRARLGVVPVYQWLAGCTVHISWNDASEKEVTISPPSDRSRLLNHFINWFQTAHIGRHALDAFDVVRVNIPRPGGAWSYPLKDQRAARLARQSSLEV